MDNNLKNTIEKGKEEIQKAKDGVQKAKKEHDEKQRIKRRRRFVLKIFRSIIFILVLAIAVLVVKYCVDRQAEPKPQPTHKATSELIDVRDIAELQVANVIYNSVATIDKDGNITQKEFEGEKEVKKNVSRYIAYKGQILVSYDLSKVEIKKDEDRKVYVVLVPEPSLEPDVINAEFEHIVIDAKSEKEYSPAEARELCLEDLKVKFNNDRDIIKETAHKNMKSAIDAYLMLLIEKDYSIEYETLRVVA